MRSHVTVTWSGSSTYVFDLDEVQPMPQEQARVWLDEQFVAFQCEPLRLTGKVLNADKVVAVAHAAGKERFSEPEYEEWALTFARASSAILAKPVITIDVPAMTIGY